MEFVVFPDHPASPGLCSALEWADGYVLTHHSGRPWVIGAWDDRMSVHAVAGPNQLLLLGRLTATAETLTERLARVRTIHELEPILSDLAGCFAAIGSIDGEVRVRGNVSAIHQVFHTTVAGTTVAADRPERIAALAGRSIDESMLALQMLAPYGPPWPLDRHSMWHDVCAVDGGSALRIGADGRGETERWWSPPEAQTPLPEAVGTLHEALADAVASCAGAVGSAHSSFDLSGGMDSTSLCYLASWLGVSFATIHYESVDPASDDSAWAARCRQDLAATEHVVVPGGSWSPFYGELDHPAQFGPSLESPYIQVSRHHVEHAIGQCMSVGATRHVAGHGADELFRPGGNYFNAYVRRHPLRSREYRRRARANTRMSHGDLFRTLRRPLSFDAWLDRSANELHVPAYEKPRVEWDFPVRMPPWATPDATAIVRRRFQEARDSVPAPLAETAHQHGMIRSAQSNGMTVRQCSRIGEPFGVTFEAPYLDDRVLDAALSIRLGDRVVPGRNKPILAAAMRSAVPPDVLDRDYKGVANEDMFASVRRHRGGFQEICEDSRLARLGLLDSELLRRAVSGVHADLRPIVPLQPTWACEMWLRSEPVDELVGARRTAPE